MTVSTTTSRDSYTGNAVNDEFAYTFRILEDSHLQVDIVDTTDGSVTTKAITTDYTVTGAGDTSGGTVTFTAGNIPTATEKVILKRNIPLKQETDYIENDTFPASSHEDALDKLTMIVQQLQEEVNRALKVPDNDVISDAEITTADLTAEYVFRVNAAGTAVETETTTTILNDNVDNFTALSTVDSANDLLMIYDNSSSTFKKVTVSNVVAVISAANTVSGGTGILAVQTGDDIAISTVDSEIDHDATTNFVVDEHVAHTGVSVTAGDGLSGGGDITTSRTLNIDVAGLTGATVASLDEVLIADVDNADAIRKVTAQSIADLAGGAALPVVDTTSIVEDPVDGTKEMRIDVGAVTTGTVRVLTMPDQDVDLTPDTGTFQAAGGGGGAWAWVSTTTASASASLAFTDLTATAYMLIIKNLIPATDSTFLHLTVSNDNGSTYAAVDYSYVGTGYDGGGITTVIVGTSATEILLTDDSAGIGNGGSVNNEYGYNACIILSNTSTASSAMSLNAQVSYQEGIGDLVYLNIAGISSDDGAGGATEVVDAVKLAMSSGNITSGVIELYSIVTS